MAKAKLKLYNPHDGQVQFHSNRARFRIATCGRRWGKTYACVNELAKTAWEHPRTVCWWVAPVYGQTMIAYRLFLDKFWGAIQKENRSIKRIELWNGSAVEFKSADNFNALRGEGVYFMVLDEASLISKEAWENALRPTLSDNMGKAILVSTPKGRNWFYHLWMRGNSEEYSDYASFHFPTSNNPFIDPEEIAEAENTLPSDVFRQEYLAEFLQDGAGVFRGIHACIGGALQPPQTGRRYVVGVDWAKHKDFSVFVVMDKQTKKVVAFERQNKVDYALQMTRLATLAKKYNKARILMDSTGVGDPLLEQLKRTGLEVEGFNFTNNSKQQLIESLIVEIEQKQVAYPNIPVLIGELELYQYEFTRAGNVRYNAPEGFHDDCVIALALAVWATKTGFEILIGRA